MVVVEASGLGLRTRRGWVFRDVHLSAAAGELHAITGPPGSGRTSLLLALAGRFPTTEGRLLRHGPAALGQVAGVHEPDPALTVAEHIQERLLLLGPVPRRRRQLVPVAAVRARRAYRRDAFATAIAGAGLTGDVPFDPATRGRDLTPVQRQVLGLVLATLSGPRLIVADDVDAGSDPPERAWLWAVLARLAEQGYAVIASARAGEPGSLAIEHRLGDPPPVPSLTSLEPGLPAGVGAAEPGDDAAERGTPEPVATGGRTALGSGADPEAAPPVAVAGRTVAGSGAALGAAPPVAAGGRTVAGWGADPEAADVPERPELGPEGRADREPDPSTAPEPEPSVAPEPEPEPSVALEPEPGGAVAPEPRRPVDDPPAETPTTTSEVPR